MNYRLVYHRWIYKDNTSDMLNYFEKGDHVETGREKVFVLQKSKYEKRTFIKIWRPIEDDNNKRN